MKARGVIAKRATPAKAPAQVSASLADLEKAIGGRPALIAALLHAPKSSNIEYLLGIIAQPRMLAEGGRHQGDHSLADLCAQGGITPGELIEAYKAGEINRAQALAVHQVGQRLEAVAADTMRMALPREQVCVICEGLGTLLAEPTKKIPNPEPEACKACAGTGHADVEGDIEHKKLALEMGKLLQKGGGVNVQVNQQVGILGASAGGSLERMQAATDAILYGEEVVPPVAAVDAEVLEEEDAPVIEGDWHDEARG